MSFADKLQNFVNGDGWNEHDETFRARHSSAGRSDYEQTRPAYQYGYAAGLTPENRGRSFEQAEPTLQSSWAQQHASQAGDWSNVRDYARDAYTRGQEQVLTLSEEELAVGTRTVSAGEVSVQKRVETEHVAQSVPLTHEEVTIERRPVTDGRQADASFTNETISVPLTAEEAVVEKRNVVKEEIVVTKHAVQENQTVEADLRKERAEIDTSRSTARPLTDEARGN